MKRLAHTFTSRAAFGWALGLAVGLGLAVKLWRLGVEWPMGAMLGTLLAGSIAAFIIDRPYEHRRARLKRAAKGLCTRCGYSLRGNVSGICPECGTPVRT